MKDNLFQQNHVWIVFALTDINFTHIGIKVLIDQCGSKMIVKNFVEIIQSLLLLLPYVLQP